MAESKDISFNNDGLVIENGDFLVNLSDNMDIEHILTASKGQFYQNPLVGVGIMGLIKAPVNITKIKRDIRLQVTSDNKIINKLDVDVDGDDFKMYIDVQNLIK